MTDALFLVRLILDRRALARVAARHRLPRNVDDGYFVHAGLAQLFATSAEPAAVPLCSFAEDDIHAAIEDQPDLLYALAYAHESADALMDRMGSARAEILRVCKSNEVPGFHAGQRLGFRTRACPIVRTKTPGDRVLGLDRRGKVKSREMDAFVHATLNIPKETYLSREVVYVDWLRRQFGSASGATLEEGARLTQFRRDVLHRRGGGERIERPNAVLEGTLVVADPVAFRATLARGLGRHRAFGFGMLLLRPPGAS